MWLTLWHNRQTDVSLLWLRWRSFHDYLMRLAREEIPFIELSKFVLLGVPLKSGGLADVRLESLVAT